jgi:cytochrome c oxidase cbb3-type subunit 3
MSDFFSPSWSWLVYVITLVSIFACAFLLWATSKQKVSAADPGDGTTGHVWDGDLREMNNPLPRWWVGLFAITMVFGLVYLILYPGLGASAGVLNWSQAGQYQAEVAKAEAAEKPLYARFMGVPPEQLAGDTQAMAVGERLFMNNCAQCHGSDARGSKGFPNLTDKDWLWGDSAEAVHVSIAKGRQGVMPPMAAAVGSASDVRDLAQYVLSLSGSPHNAVQATAGKAKFAACAACHGADGKGNPALGAPNLTDDVWLHGWGEEAIVAMVTKGKTNVMPAWEGKLTAEQIHVLTGYVLSLSRGKGAAVAAAAGK